ncbi:MAG: hypothetical protein IKE31_01920 [Eubacterium sp.]|nr:hypothetical protein [Eubacterium sp.]
MRIDELLQMPYWIIDIIPKQVPKDSPGQYFSVEKHYLEKERLAGIKQKHINIILKINCYRDLVLYEDQETNPSPEQIADEMMKRSLFIMIDDAMILSEPEDTHLTVFNPSDQLLELIKELAVGEGLFVWKPMLDKKVSRLNEKGIVDTTYED